jgi:hypothetical protein
LSFRRWRAAGAAQQSVATISIIVISAAIRPTLMGLNPTTVARQHAAAVRAVDADSQHSDTQFDERVGFGEHGVLPALRYPVRSGGHLRRDCWETAGSAGNVIRPQFRRSRDQAPI